jgi:hypothetical protein
MPGIWDSIRLFAAEQRSRLSAKSASAQLHDSQVNRAIERVVDSANPRLRALPGYRRKLFDAVARSLDFCAELTGRIPGPLTLDRESWSKDPVVNALFGSYERMRQCITSAAVRAYVKETALETGDCFGVLLAMPEVRTQLGTELFGDAVQRDVRQTVVSFSDHELLLPSAEPGQVREQLKDAALDVVVEIATQDIAEQEGRIAELENRLRIVRIKQKAVSPTGRGIDFLGSDSGTRRADYEAASGRIRELERDLAEARVGLTSLGDYLERLEGILLHPERHLGIKLERTRLDRMNVVRGEGEDGASAGMEIEFARGYRGDRPGRVLLLVRFPRAELIPDRDRLAELERYAST